MFVIYNWLMMLLSSVMSLPIFCLLNLSITERGVLKSPPMIVDSLFLFVILGSAFKGTQDKMFGTRKWPLRVGFY